MSPLCQRVFNQAMQWIFSSTAGARLTDQFYVASTCRRFRHALAHPHAAQQRIFEALLISGRQTHFGRDHELAAVSTLSDYQRALPVCRYEELKPYIDRAIAGQTDVLWPGETNWFAESSGTTGHKKQIPVPASAWKNLYQSTGATYIALLLGRLRAEDRRRFLRGKTIFFVGNLRRGERNPRQIFGDITAFGVHLLPWYLEFSRAPSKQITLFPNWEERLYRMAEATIHEDVVHLAGATAWLPNFARIVLEITGKEHLRQVWPNLMVATVGGINPAPYLRDLNGLILGQRQIDGADFFYSEVYNGTEGFYATQIDDGHMVLMPDAQIFYEFIGREDAAAGNFSCAVPLEGVELGVEYALVISSINGLWRYLIGDTVRFTDRDPYRLVVSGRVKQYLNIAGEEMLIDTADAAIARICADLGFSLVDYTVAPLKQVEGNAFHLWLLEVTDPQSCNPVALAEQLDRTLIEIHYDYGKFRSTGARSGHGFGLAPPLLLLLPPGTFLRWLQARLAGRVGGQSKVPRLSMETAVVGEILALLPPDQLDGMLAQSTPATRTAVYALVGRTD
ncbi:MAG: GH3 auxin-responsive promoter family protein [Caldilineaceae bacterium]|nr:GH3 auxin-responsive promoter family protein [Caldilineaceae bacterium]